MDSQTLVISDSFNLTFGKENWGNYNNMCKTIKQLKKQDIPFKTVLINQVNKKQKDCFDAYKNKLAAISQISKQNDITIKNSNTKNDRRGSIFDIGRKKLGNLSINKKQSYFQKNFFLRQKKAESFLTSYDFDRKFPSIQVNLNPTKIQRKRFFSVNQNKIGQYPQKNIFPVDCKVPQIIKVKNSILWKSISKNRYDDEMVKLDGLIQKINTRIKLSSNYA